MSKERLEFLEDGKPEELINMINTMIEIMTKLANDKQSRLYVLVTW